jgi:hypothetical protein
MTPAAFTCLALALSGEIRADAPLTDAAAPPAAEGFRSPAVNRATHPSTSGDRRPVAARATVS